MTANPIVTAIFAVFTSILDWFVDCFGVVTEIFYADSSLTVLGTLATIGFGIAMVLLVLRWVVEFFRNRA